MQSAAIGKHNGRVPPYGPQNLNRNEHLSRRVVDTVSSIVQFVTSFFYREPAAPAQADNAEADIQTVDFERLTGGPLIKAISLSNRGKYRSIGNFTEKHVDATIFDIFVTMLSMNTEDSAYRNHLLNDFEDFPPEVQALIISKLGNQ